MVNFQGSVNRRHILATLTGFGLGSSAFASSEGAAFADYEAILKPQFSPASPGCAVLVKRGGAVLWRAAYGSSGKLGAPTIPEAHFRIGSITKTFTATLALRLVDAGRLHLDGAVGDYLPGGPRELARITLRQLLGHTSGLGQYTELADFRRIASRAVTAEELIALCAKTPRVAVAGERYIYSNTGYAVIGSLIEAVSRRPFEQVLYEEVLNPLGLRDTGFDDRLGNSARLVLGHGRLLADGSRAPVQAVHPSAIAASGGLISTIDDLEKWNSARVSGTLLSSASASLLTSPVPLADGSSAPSGLGWMLRDVLDQKAVEHSGSTQGFIGHVMYLPAAELFVAVLMNESSGRQPGPGYLCEQLAAATLGKTTATWTVVNVAPEALQQLVGEYGEPDVSRNIELYQGRLMVRRGPSRALLEALSPTHFIDRRRAVVHYKFTIAPSGAVKALTIQRAGSEDLVLVRK